MNSNFAALHYRKTEKMNSEPLNDTNSMVLKCYEELCNSIKIFQKNIKPTPENLKRIPLLGSLKYSVACPVVVS